METTLFEVGGKAFPSIDLHGFSPQEWDDYRSKSLHIGGSDIGTILGVNKYKDAITLFCEKTGFIKSEFVPNDYTEGGHIDEAGILKRLEHFDGFQWAANVRPGKTFRKIEKPDRTFFPTKYPWLAANVDGLIEYDIDFPNETGIAEAKKISGSVLAAAPGGCPPSYLGQVVGYMLGLELPFARIALLEDGVRLHVRTLSTDMPGYEEIAERILLYCPRFYQAVLDGVQVMASTTERDKQTALLMEVIGEYEDVLRVTHLSKDYLNAIAGDDRKGTIQDTGMDGVLLAYEKAEKALSAATQAEGRIKNELIEYLIQNNASVLEGSSHRAAYNKRFTFKKL